MINIILKFAAVCLLIGSVGAQAVPIIYDVNQTVGTGSVVGTIETDGTVGVLAESNILDFMLTLFDGTDTNTISLSGGGFFNLGDPSSLDFFSATATQLLFDFTNPAGVGFIDFSQSFGGNLWAFSLTNGGGMDIFHSDVLATPSIHHLAVSGSIEEVLVVGTKQAVPEPSTLVLLSIGFIGIGAARKLKKN